MLHCGLSPVEVVRDDTTCLDFHLGDESISILHIFGMLLALSVSQPDGASLTTHHVFGENVGRALFYWRWHIHTHVRTHARTLACTNARTHAHSQHLSQEPYTGVKRTVMLVACTILVSNEATATPDIL